MHHEPTFTCTLILGTSNTSTGRFAIGLGLITVAGAGFTELDGHNFCGFYLKKTSGTVKLGIFQQKSDNSYDYENDVVTVSSGGTLELFMKVKSSGVTYWYRSNAGTLVEIDTLTTGNPADQVESNVYIANTNMGNAADYDVQVTCAGYEH